MRSVLVLMAIAALASMRAPAAQPASGRPSGAVRGAAKKWNNLSAARTEEARERER